MVAFGRKKLIVFLTVFFPLLILLAVGGYFLHKFWRLSRIITTETTSYSNVAPPQEEEYFDPSLMGEDSYLDEETKQEIKDKLSLFDYAKEKFVPEKGSRERINILLLGRAIPGYPGSDLTDTIILASLNPTTYTCSLLSIPRDLYVRVPGTKTSTKINAIYVYGLKSGGHEKGIDLLKQTVADVTGQKVDYYAMVNFAAFEQMVDLVSGVDVSVEENIYDDRYPGPNYSYQTFKIEKGQHHLDGATALKYVRVRHNAGGDFGRARRQQQVLEALKNKFFAEKNLRQSLDFFNESLKVVEKNVKTDISFSDYFPFIFILKDLNSDNIVNKVLDNSSEGLLENYNPVIGRVVAYTLRPRAGNYFEIRKLAANIFNLDRIKKLEETRKKESSSVVVYAKPSLAGQVGKINNILRNEGYQVINTTSEAPDPIKLWQRNKINGLNESEDKTFENSIKETDLSLSSLRETTVYDNAGGQKPFSLDDLSRRLKADVSLFQDRNTYPADFVVTLGDNLDQIFAKEEDSFFLTDQGLDQEEKDF